MGFSASFADMLVDVLSPLGRVSVRRMFGGGGVFCEGVMFGLVAEDVLYLKGNDGSAAAYEREACERFTYVGKGRVISLPYWRMPERLLDDPDEMVEWARRALRVALDNAAKRPAAKPRASARPIRKR